MQEFPVKRTNLKTFRKDMVTALGDIFATVPREKGEKFEIVYGALERLTVWAGEEGKTLCVESVSRKDVPDETILDTNRRFREFLERVTGYTAKERVKMAKKKAEEG